MGYMRFWRLRGLRKFLQMAGQMETDSKPDRGTWDKQR
jgi:hypothetical protein